MKHIFVETIGTVLVVFLVVFSEYQRFINFNLETSSNNVIVLRNPDNPEESYIAMYKGENSSKVLDTFFSAAADGVGGYNGVGIIVDIILPTGNAGGMNGKFHCSLLD